MSNYVGLSTTFYTVDHRLLLTRLKYGFGFSGNVLNWIETYLCDRHRRVVVGQPPSGAESDDVKLTFGVPQGSILGPVLLTLYIAPLGDICRSHNVHFHSYANDQQNYLAFCPSVEGSKEKYLETLQMMDVIRWMHTNLLKLNDNKTEFLVTGRKQQLRKIEDKHRRSCQLLTCDCIMNGNMVPSLFYMVI